MLSFKENFLMKKKIYKRNFIALAVVACLLLVFTVVGFNVPFTTNRFKGFAKSINTGLDFGNGTRATYTVTKADYSEFSDAEFMDKGVDIIQDLATKKYTEANVYRVGDDKIVIEIPDTAVPQDLSIGKLEIKTEKSESAEVMLNGSHIKSSKFQMNGADYGVLIQFTDEGAELMEEMTSSASSTSSVDIVFCLNSDYDNALSVSTSSAVENGYVYFTMSSKESAKLFANCIKNSKYGINLVQEGDNVTIYSNVTTFGKVICAVIVGLLVVGSVVYLVLKYKDLGWITSLALVFFALFNIITFALIESFRLTMGSYLGMLLGYIVTFFTVVILLEKIRSEFESGKKFIASFKSGYIKSLPTNIDIFAISVIFSIICLIMTSGFMYSFALAFLINCLYGALTSLAIMLWFTRMYLKINNTSATRLNFRKEVKTNGQETK